MPVPALAPRILVVAADADMRRSLEFMLRAEGYAVSARETWLSPDESLDGEVAIIDHAALDRTMTADERLRALGPAAIILASRPGPFHGLDRATVVRKPLLDRALIDTLQAALELRRIP